MSDWIPEAKVRPPAIASYVIARPRLVDVLSRAAQQRLTLLVAPAGSGKTTLLSQYVLQAREPVLWYRCDPGDADPTAFVAGLVSAAWAALPAARPALERARTAIAGGSPPFAALRVLVAALEEVRGGTGVVIDDAHHVTASGGSQLLSHLLQWLPEGFHLIVASRTMPELPLVLLTGLSQASGLGSQELRFAHDEAVALLRGMGGRSWADATVEALLTHCQGWATALVLYGQTAPGEDLTAPDMLMPGAQDALFSYIATSIVAGLPRRLHRFLFAVSVLPTFGAAEADALREAHDSDRLIADIAARGLFLESLPGGVYRFHDLFRSFLESHLRTTAPARWRLLHRRAAALAERRGAPAQALHHMATGGSPAALVELLARLAPGMSTSQHAEALIAWCDRVPLALRLTQPALVRAHARALLTRGRTDEALALMVRAAAASAEPEGGRWTGADARELRILRAHALFQLGRLEDTVATADAELRDGGTAAVTAAAVRQIRGCALVRLGRAREGIAEIQAALEVFAQQGLDDQIASVCHNVGQFLLDCGDARSAERYLDRAAQVKQARGQDALLSSTLLAQGLLRHLRGETSEAQVLLEESRALAERTGQVLVEIAALESLGTLAAEENRSREAVGFLDAAERLAEAVGQRSVLLLIACARVRVALAEGDGARARVLLQEIRRRASLPGEKGLAALMAGLVALDCETAGTAADQLQRAVDQLGAAGVERHRARALLLLASAVFRHGARGRALALLDEVADLVTVLGCEGYLVAEQARAGAVLRYARDHPRLRVATQALVGRLLGQAGDEPGGSGARAAVDTRPERVVAGAPPLRVVALGGSAVWSGDEAIPASRWVRGAARDLFFYALAQERPIARDTILDTLWPEDGPGEAQATFWMASHHMRRALPGVRWTKEENRYVLRLPPGSSYDVTTFDGLAATALGRDPAVPSAQRRAAAERAVALYGGAYLADLTGLWALPLRTRLHALWMDLLLVLSAACRGDGQLTRAAAYAQRAVAADPLDERAQRALIDAQAAGSDLHAALRTYQAYAVLLREELGETPSPGLRTLAGRLAAGVGA